MGYLSGVTESIKYHPFLYNKGIRDDLIEHKNSTHKKLPQITNCTFFHVGAVTVLYSTCDV